LKLRETQPSVDCQANQETQGIYSQPFVTPFNLDVHALVAKDRAYINRCKSLNGSVLRYISTKNPARDMDLLPAGEPGILLGFLALSLLVGFAFKGLLGVTI